MRFKILIGPIALALLCSFSKARADSCAPDDRMCIFELTLDAATSIEAPSWRDKILRETAKSLAAKGEIQKALSLIEQVQTPDTRAMTIRGIGTEAANLDLPKEEYDLLFAALNGEAEKIEHLPSRGIAYTYIAMAQALAGDDEGATKTAASMTNESLRNKAFAESAEIQAAQNRPKQAKVSIAQIDDEAFRDKAYGLITRIYTDQNQIKDALDAAQSIQNAYQRADALLYILNAEKKD